MMNKKLKTALILFAMVATFLLIAWGVDTGWIWLPASLLLIYALGKYVWMVADEIRKMFFDKEESTEGDE